MWVRVRVLLTIALSAVLLQHLFDMKFEMERYYYIVDETCALTV